MNFDTTNAYETAKHFIEKGITLSNYKRVQEERLEWLRFAEWVGDISMRDGYKKSFEFGEKVLIEMKILLAGEKII